MEHKIHVYCNIIDNYGDIGGAYRLAKALTKKNKYKVTLWFSNTPPEIFNFSDSPSGLSFGVIDENTPKIQGDLVVSTFSNILPSQLRHINRYYLDLGYMSLDLKKSQYYPNTGRHSFHPGYLDGFVIETPPADFIGEYDTIRIYWYSYEKDLPETFRTELENYSRKVQLITTQLGPYSKGSLEIVPVPFMSQKSFDWILSTCDINFVRGEDSFVRSQLTQAITIWQPYNIDPSTIISRLQTSFGDRYTKRWPDNLKHCYEDFVLSTYKTPLTPILDNLQILKPLCRDWKNYLIELGDISNVIHKHILKFLNI